MCPRLRDLSACKLPRGWSVPENLEGVTVRRVSVKSIEREWDDLVHLVASMAPHALAGTRFLLATALAEMRKPGGARRSPFRKTK